MKCINCGFEFDNIIEMCPNCGMLSTTLPDDNKEILEIEHESEKDEISDEEHENGVVNILKTISVLIMIVGIIIGFILGRDIYGHSSFLIMLLYWFVAFVIGMSFWGFAEIISLLQKLVNK